MTAIARELDAKLSALDPDTAQSLERLVRDALALVTVADKGPAVDRLPTDFFKNIAAEFGSEPFERPNQGDFEKREEW